MSTLERMETLIYRTYFIVAYLSKCLNSEINSVKLLVKYKEHVCVNIIKNK